MYTTTSSTSSITTRRTPRPPGFPAYFLGRPAVMYRRRYPRDVTKSPCEQ